MITVHRDIPSSRLYFSIVLWIAFFSPKVSTQSPPSDYVPWQWEVTTYQDEPLDFCPSSVSILVNFAIINVLVSLISLLVGNSKFIEKITCGLIDDDDKHISWYYMFIFPLGINLGSNALIAHTYKHTAGFETFSTWELTLFYTTRPRLTWLVLVFFMNLSAISSEKSDKSNKYIKAAKAAVAAEVVLQGMSSYYMGWTVSFASKHNYYLNPSGAPKNANIMYAGALLSLISLFFTLVCLVIILLREKRHSRSFYLMLLICCTSWLGSWLFWVGFVLLEGVQ